MWDKKGDCVTLSNRLSSLMKTRETTCSTVKRRTSGPTATRNHGKTLLITPRQKRTRRTFWINISAWNGRRVSTEGRETVCVEMFGLSRFYNTHTIAIPKSRWVYLHPCLYWICWVCEPWVSCRKTSWDCEGSSGKVHRGASRRHAEFPYNPTRHKRHHWGAV